MLQVQNLPWKSVPVLPQDNGKLVNTQKTSKMLDGEWKILPIDKIVTQDDMRYDPGIVCIMGPEYIG